MKRITVRVCLVACIMATAGTPLAAQQAASASRPSPQLAISKVIIAADDVTMLIEGVNFGSTAPAVTVDGMQVTVTFSTPTSVSAVLPGPLAAGSYRLTIARGPAAVDVGHFDLTIGAAGPTGPAGPQGPPPDLGSLDSRYAPLTHTHSVAEVAGAATLGANSFTGNQTIAGNVGSTGQVSAKTGLFSNNTASNAVRVEQSGASSALFASTSSAGHSGVFARNTSGAGSGVHGEAGATGVFGMATSTSGTDVNGVFGWAVGGSGVNSGVRGRSDSPSGVGGLFENSTGGTLIQGRVGFAEKFRVDGTGAVYASSYRDLAGNPIPTATGDITGVAAGNGLTGGGTSGDVGVALDTAFTDNRYAPLSHGHNVAAISGAATLGANSFTGNQAINGSLTAGDASFSRVTASRNTDHDTAIIGTSTAALGFGVMGETSATNGLSAGVYGRASAANGAGSVHGLYGETIGFVGSAVRGLARQGIGVEGYAQGAGGVAVLAQAPATTGNAIAMYAVVNSGTATAAIVENNGAGNLLIGRTNGVQRFRVDGTGTVHAAAYKDSNGNTIGSGLSGYDQNGMGSSSGIAPGQLHPLAYSCAAPKKVLGGGCKETNGQLTLVSSGPKVDGTGWECVYRNDGTAAANAFIQVFAICANVQ